LHLARGYRVIKNHHYDFMLISLQALFSEGFEILGGYFQAELSRNSDPIV
jgi:hypothetical protein